MQTITACLEQFSNQLAKKKLGHAWLITGMPGSGKLRLVGGVIDLLLPGHPEWIAANTHPDLYVLTPDMEKVSGHITIEQVRDVMDFMEKTPQHGVYKMVVIHAAHRLTISASNALLKSLEEPLGNTVWILVTAQPSRLLPTIRSRCQQLNLPAIRKPSVFPDNLSTILPEIITEKFKGNPSSAVFMEGLYLWKEWLNEYVYMRCQKGGSPQMLQVYFDFDLRLNQVIELFNRTPGLQIELWIENLITAWEVGENGSNA